MLKFILNVYPIYSSSDHINMTAQIGEAIFQASLSQSNISWRKGVWVEFLLTNGI